METGMEKGVRDPVGGCPSLSVPRIDASENQVDETIFVLESFIESTMKRL